MSRIRPVTATPATKWQLPSQQFAPLPICVKMFHFQGYLAATIVQIQTLVRRWLGERN